MELDPDDAPYVLAKYLALELGHHFHLVLKTKELNKGWESFDDIPTDPD